MDALVPGLRSFPELVADRKVEVDTLAPGDSFTRKLLGEILHWTIAASVRCEVQGHLHLAPSLLLGVGRLIKLAKGTSPENSSVCP